MDVNKRATDPFRRFQTSNTQFSFDEIFRFPEHLHEQDVRGGRKRIGIIGAGIAGLSSAYELSKLHHDVILFEMTNRPGGRIYTHYFNDGNHAELGAMRIPGNHDCTLHYVKEFQLPLGRFVNYNPNAFYHIRGQKTRLDAYEGLFSAFQLREDELRDPLRLYEDLMKELMDALSAQEKWEMFAAHPQSETLQKYVETSLWQFLHTRLSSDALDFVGHATGMIQYERASLLEVLIDYFGLFRVNQYELVGGMETLVAAFTKRLKDRIRYNARVTALQVTEDGVSVHWNRFGYKTVEHFDYIICTAPAPALSRIDFYPDLPAAQKQALRGIKYASSAKTIVHTTARPWEFEDHIYGGGSFTDLPIQQCWYPSDNSIPTDSELYLAFNGDERERYSGAPLRWGAQNQEVSHAPAVFTASYLWESNAQRFLALTEQEQTELVLQNVKKLHPTVEKYIDDIIHWSWDQQSSPGFGAFAYFAPGEHARYQNVLCQPYPLEQPRVFFAGEHLAIAHAWIQGAIQTALDATINVLRAPSSQKKELIAS